MGRRPRRNHSPAFKAKVALDAIRGDKTIAELCEKHDLHANQIADWKHQLLERAHQNGHAERKEMIDPEHKLSITRQDELVNISRGSVYYLPVPTSATDLLLMRRIDELHLDFPFTGVRMLRDMLKREGHAVGRKSMSRPCIEALYRKPNTSKKHPGHKIYPYLLRGMTIDRPNHAWAMDITYIPMARGFVYLTAVVDWATRRVLAHRVSITMDALYCVEAVEEAIARYGRPEIMNTDQGSQFTSVAFTDVLKTADIQ